MGIDDHLKVMIPVLLLGHQLPSEMKPNQSVIIELMFIGTLKKKPKKTVSFDANKLLKIKEHSPL